MAATASHFQQSAGHRLIARLRAIHGRTRETRVLLSPVYNWFTEGFDTPVLKEAKALLDELT